MRILHNLLAIAALGALSGCASLSLYNKLPGNQKLLFAPMEERDKGFRVMENYGVVKLIAAGTAARPLPAGSPLVLPEGVEGYMTRQRMAGVIVLQHGKVRLEKYGLGFAANGRWASFSMAKSITSALAGAALRDGAIKSLDDKVTDYIPGLRGSVYDVVTVRQLLTMTSGVKWSENYSDPKSDVARFIIQQPGPEGDATVSYMKTLTREAPPGSRWVYKTGESNLVGVLVSSATGKSLSEYLSEKIWKPFGMERDAIWFTDSSGHELGGCCISASLRDYARFGQFMLDGAMAGGQPVVADGWIEQATRPQIRFGIGAGTNTGGNGYGYQWWAYGDGSYQAIGIFGQSIAINPQRGLVITIVGNWPSATGSASIRQDRAAFFRSVIAAVDATGNGVVNLP